jgi:hypothetical protein
MPRRRGSTTTVALLILLTGTALSLTAAPPAQALSPSCPPTENSLTITQTSVMDSLAAGIGPVAITGTVENNGADSTDIVAIEVRITGVTLAQGSVPGTCDVSDYFLAHPRMPVGQTLGPGGFATFAGASIGFSNKSVNQDACKGATVQLLYTANPT